MAWASRVKRSAKAGSLADLRGEDFEGDEAVEGFLAGLVDGAHAAAAEECEDVEFGEERGEFGRGRGASRREFGGLGFGVRRGGCWIRGRV